MTTTFDPPKQLAGAETHVMYDMKVAVRPTDGAAFVIGSTTGKVWFGRIGGAPVRDIHGTSGDNPAQWPTLAFGSDGTGYASWRGTGWLSWIQVIPAGWDSGILPPPYEISSAMAAPAGAKFVSQVDLATSRTSNKLYAVGYFEMGEFAATGFIESSDGGRSWNGFKLLARDNTRSNQSPQLHVGRVTDNVHVLARNGNNLIAISRIGGEWDKSPTVLAESNMPGWDVRAIDGHVSKSVAESTSGKIWAVWKNPGTHSFAVAHRLPGEAWVKVTDAVLSDVYTQTVICDTTRDGQVYAFTQGDSNGAFLVPLASIMAPIAIKPETIWGSAGVGMDFSGYGGKLWLAWTRKGGGPETTYYTSAVYDGTIPIPPPPVVTAPPVVIPPSVPVAEFLPPSSVSAEAPSFNQVYIYWKDKTSDEVEFSVERKENDISYRIVGSAAANASQWLDVIGIEPETKYTYRVRAHKTGLYSNYSMEVSVVTPAVPAPEPVVTPPAPVLFDPNVVVKNGFNLGHGMLDYWKKFDTVGVPHPMGLPKSNEFDWVSAAGKKYTVQVFERLVLGYDETEPDVRYTVQPLIIGPEWLAAHKK